MDDWASASISAMSPAGYCLYFLASFLMLRSRDNLMQGLCFGVALLLGMVPTLVANAINAGSPFSTTYSDGDAAAPKLDFEVLRLCLLDLQFLLLLIAIVWTALMWWRGRREIAFVVSSNLAINIVFFVTHPIFTQYYAVPAAAPRAGSCCLEPSFHPGRTKPLHL